MQHFRCFSILVTIVVRLAFNTYDLQEALLPSLKVILASELSKSRRSHVSSIKDKLSTGKYSNARDYVEDVWSMFEDVRLSKNNSTSEHYDKVAKNKAFMYPTESLRILFYS